MSTREILYRGKRTDNGEWVEGCYIKDEKDLSTAYIGYILGVDGETVHDMDIVKVDQETVCQDTGLTDKNGRKIFDGDICEIHSSYIDEEDGLFIVEWDEHCAKIILSGEGLEADFDTFNGSDCEVVGNIYDNPELLNSGGEP